MAERQGYQLRKSRRRDPWATDYGRWWVVDSDTNALLTSESGMGLDGIETWLTTPRSER